MGYQLWTSPDTGHRRRGTRLIDLHAALGAQITAGTIFEYLQSCPADAQADEMYRLLKARDFDLAGVRNEENGPVIAFVTTESLRGGSVRKHLQPLTDDDWVQDTLPLTKLMERLKNRQFVFVRAKSDAIGIIRGADLNKPPIRVFLFGLVSLLEMHMSYWLRVEYPNDSWRKSLKPDRVKAAKKVQANRRQRNQDLELVECLQFCDKRDLVLDRKDVCSEIGIDSIKRANARLKKVEHLRNTLAHSQYDLVRGTTWKELIELVQWIETVIHKSDAIVEKQALQSAHRAGVAALW